MKILFIQILTVLSEIVLFGLVFYMIIECVSDAINRNFRHKTPEQIQSEIKERKAQIKAYLKGWFFE